MKSVSHLNARESTGGDFAEDPVFLESQDAASWLDHEIGRDVPREKPANQPRRPKRSWLARMLFVFLLLFFLLVVGMAASLYLGRHWLLAQAERKALEALAGQGIHLAYEAARWEFPRGVVLNDVRVYEDAGRQTPLMTASNLGVHPDLYSLVREWPPRAVSATVTFRDAALKFYRRGEEMAALDRLDSHITATAGEISIDRFEALFSGLLIDARGRVMLGGETSAETTPDAAAAPKAPPRALAERLDFSPLGDWKRWVAVSSDEGAPPRLECTFQVSPGLDPEIDARGRLWGRSFRWRELPVDSVIGEFAYHGTDQVLELPQLSLMYAGAPIEGREVRMRLPENLVEIGSLHSKANLVDLISRIAPEKVKLLSAIEWIDAPEIGLGGTVNLADFWNSDLAIDYAHASGMTIDWEGRKLPVRGVKSRFTVKGEAISTENFEGAILDGSVRGGFRARRAALGFEYDADLNVADLPLQSLAGLAGSEKPMPGFLSGTFKGTGAADASRLNGAGEVHLAAENLLGIPVMGEIQELMGTVATVFGAPRESTLDATYTIAGGQIQTEDLEMAGSGVRIKAAGSYRIPDRLVAARAHGFLDGLAGIPKEVMGKALEVSIEGPIDDLKTRIDNAPMEFSSDEAKAAISAMETVAKEAQSITGKGTTDPPAESMTGAASAAVSGLLKKAQKELQKLGVGKEMPAETGAARAGKSQETGQGAAAPAQPGRPAPLPPIVSDSRPSAPAMPVGPPLPPRVEETTAAEKPPAPKPPAPKPPATPEEAKTGEPRAEPEKKILRAVPLIPKPGEDAPVFRD